MADFPWWAADSKLNPLSLCGTRSSCPCRHNDARSRLPPFDRTRDGVVLGEGVALSLEDLEHAGSTRPKIWRNGRVLAAFDVKGAVGCHPRRWGHARQASLEQVDHVNAHGRSRPMHQPASKTFRRTRSRVA